MTLMRLMDKIEDESLNSMYSQDAMIHTTRDIDCAMFFSIIKLSEIEGDTASVRYKGEKIQLSIDKDFVNGQSKFVKRKVCIFDKKDFIKTKLKNEFVSKSDIVTALGFVYVLPEDMETVVGVRL
jgi:hypothetical protein